MFSEHMLNKTSLSKPLLRNCSVLYTCSKLAVSTNLLLKQLVVYHHCLFANFELLITQTREFGVETRTKTYAI